MIGYSIKTKNKTRGQLQLENLIYSSLSITRTLRGPINQSIVPVIEVKKKLSQGTKKLFHLNKMLEFSSIRVCYEKSTVYYCNSNFRCQNLQKEIFIDKKNRYFRALPCKHWRHVSIIWSSSDFNISNRSCVHVSSAKLFFNAITPIHLIAWLEIKTSGFLVYWLW